MKNFLKEKRLDGFLISNIYNISYLTDFYGFSKDEREAYILITKNKNFIITDGRYKEAVLKNIPHFTLCLRSPGETVSEIIKELVLKYKIKKIGFEENSLTVFEFKSFSKKVQGVKFVPAEIKSLRVIKNENEIRYIKKACKIGDLAYSGILEKLRIGVTEKEIATELEFFIKKNRGELSFPSIVAFGKNSSMPHHQTGDKKLTRGDKFILLDFGVKFNNYCSDMTRTVFIGKVTPEIRKMYQTVLDAQKKAIEKLKTGIKASNVDKTARNYITECGFPTIPHSLGHGVGLEVHESPRLAPKSKDILKENMVFTIEPGIYIPNFGGVRIEDVVLLTKTGAKLLTHSPKGMIEV